MINFLDLQKQYLSIKTEIDEAIARTIATSSFIGGPEVSTFESEFAKFQGTRHCIGVANGTDAIEIVIEALRLQLGSEIIVPANSFIASSEAVTRAGHKVVFCDANLNDYTIDLNNLRKRISSKTTAIIAVHLYGHPCNMEPICELADEFDLKVIEDCAQAHGAEYRGRRVGSIGDAGTFSFYPGKNLGAYGDGGAIVTSNEDLAMRCRMIANHGRKSKYDHEFEGRNSRLDGIQAAILRVKLRHLERWTIRRIEIADSYLEGLDKVDGIRLPLRASDVRQVYHLFVIRVSQRDALRSHLQKLGIQTGIHYPIALPDLLAYQHLRDETPHMRVSKIADQLLSIPIGEHMSIDDAMQVMDAVRKKSS